MKALVVLLAALAADGAGAQTCTPRDVSAYRADMRDAFQRREFAYQFCGHHRRRAGMTPGTRAADQCDAEMQKITDVMTTAKAHRELQFALKGCTGELDVKR